MFTLSVRRCAALAAALLLAACQARAQEPAKPAPAPTAKPAPAPMSVPAPMPAGDLSKAAPMVWDKPCLADCGPACCDDSCNKCEKGGLCSRIGLYGEFLYLKARNADVVFAQTVDGCGAFAVPVGPLGIAQPDYSTGWGLGAMLCLDENSYLRVGWRRFESQTNARIDATDGGVIQSLVTLPSTVNCASDSFAATARYDIDFDLVDLEYNSVIWSGCKATLSYFAGVRYAHLDQDFASTFSILGDTDVATHISFDGIGPRFGLEGERELCGGFRTFGRAGLSLLAGHFGSDFAQVNTFAGTQGNLNFESDRIVPILDLELGVAWVSKGGHVRLEAGYLISWWFNTVSTNCFTDAIRANNFSSCGDNLHDDISFDGLMTRLAFHF